MAGHRKEIGGRTYTFGILPASRALPIANEIGPIYLETMAEVASMSVEALKEMAAVAGLDPEKVQSAQEAAIVKAAALNARVGAALLKRLAPSDWLDREGKPHIGLLTIVNVMFEHVQVIDGAKAAQVSLDATFTGKLALAKEVLMEALSVNFSDFFPDAPSSSSLAKGQGA